MNDTVDSPVSTSPTGPAQPGPEDLRWAEEIFEQWRRQLAAGSSTPPPVAEESPAPAG